MAAGQVGQSNNTCCACVGNGERERTTVMLGWSLWRLKSNSPYARQKAAYALAELGDERAIGPLEAALNDDVYYVRSAAAESLGELRARRSFPLLVKLLRDSNE